MQRSRQSVASIEEALASLASPPLATQGDGGATLRLSADELKAIADMRSSQSQDNGDSWRRQLPVYAPSREALDIIYKSRPEAGPQPSLVLAGPKGPVTVPSELASRIPELNALLNEAGSGRLEDARVWGTATAVGKVSNDKKSARGMIVTPGAIIGGMARMPEEKGGPVRFDASYVGTDGTVGSANAQFITRPDSHHDFSAVFTRERMDGKPEQVKVEMNDIEGGLNDAAQLMVNGMGHFSDRATATAMMLRMVKHVHVTQKPEDEVIRGLAANEEELDRALRAGGVSAQSFGQIRFDEKGNLIPVSQVETTVTSTASMLGLAADATQPGWRDMTPSQSRGYPKGMLTLAYAQLRAENPVEKTVWFVPNHREPLPAYQAGLAGFEQPHYTAVFNDPQYIDGVPVRTGKVVGDNDEGGTRIDVYSNKSKKWRQMNVRVDPTPVFKLTKPGRLALLQAVHTIGRKHTADFAVAFDNIEASLMRRQLLDRQVQQAAASTGYKPSTSH